MPTILQHVQSLDWQSDRPFFLPYGVSCCIFLARLRSCRNKKLQDRDNDGRAGVGVQRGVAMERDKRIKSFEDSNAIRSKES